MKSFVPLAARSGNLLLAAAIVLVIALAILFFPAPEIEIDIAGERAIVAADRAWTLLPGDCLQLEWDIAQGASLFIQGQARQGVGADRFCPRIFKPSPLIEWRGANGEIQYKRLDNFHLPDYLANLAGLTLLASFIVIALLLLRLKAPEQGLDLRALITLLLLAALAIALCRFVSRAMTIDGILALLDNLFLSRHWHIASLLLAGALVVGLLAGGLHQGWQGRKRMDALALGGLLLFVLLLYLPFGFDTPAHFEQWIMRAYLEGMPFRLTDGELVQRPFLTLASAAGLLITSESFHGLNIVFAFTLWGKLALFYLILRHIGFRGWQALLMAALYGSYPVDSALMSLRSISIHAHGFFTLAVLLLMLGYQRKPSRLGLAGLWLALALSVGIAENAYGLMLVLPLWWWLGPPRPRWRKLNLSLIWYLAPALKVVYMALLMLTGREFYRSGVVYGDSPSLINNIIPRTLDNLAALYQRTFFTGWREAAASLGENQWLPVALAMLALIAALAYLCWRTRGDDWLPTPRQSARTLALAALLILPAVAVLIWIEDWGSSLWQPYAWVPPVAAVALFSAILLLTAPIANSKARQAAIISLCLVLLLPAISRLTAQHGHYVSSAENKARILRGVIEQAPQMASTTRVIVLSDMPADERLRLHIDELKAGVVGPALYLILQDGVDRRGWLCLSIPECRALRMWREELPDTLVFLLDQQLNVTLLRQPATRLQAFEGVEYDITRLYQADAPLPKRLHSLLGLAPP